MRDAFFLICGHALNADLIRIKFPIENINTYCMAKPVLLVLIGSSSVSMDTVQPVHFCFGAKPGNSKFATKTVAYNKQLSNRPCSSHTGKYWPSRSLSKRLLINEQSYCLKTRQLEVNSGAISTTSCRYSLGTEFEY